MGTKPKVFTAYITRYAFTGSGSGILKTKVTLSSDDPNVVIECGDAPVEFRGEGTEWHRTKKGALSWACSEAERRLARFERMRQHVQDRWDSFAAELDALP